MTSPQADEGESEYGWTYQLYESEIVEGFTYPL